MQTGAAAPGGRRAERLLERGKAPHASPAQYPVRRPSPAAAPLRARERSSSIDHQVSRFHSRNYDPEKHPLHRQFAAHHPLLPRVGASARELLREQFYLALPMKPLCQEDCRGLCPQCGVNRNTGTCDCNVQWEDPRLAALRNLKT